VPAKRWYTSKELSVSEGRSFSSVSKKACSPSIDEPPIGK
jgi:hypothetical protein